MSHLATVPADPAPDLRDTFILAVAVTDCFVDRTYQRDLDLPRARRIADNWNPRLLGVVDVSDRGADYADDGTPARYALVNGQHRWEAAKLRDPSIMLVARIHEGLSVAEEAQLFYDIDTSTRRLTGWDRWMARRGAGDAIVLAVDDIAQARGYEVTDAAQNGTIRCVSTCEKVIKLGGPDLFAATLDVIREVWAMRLDAVDAPIVYGIATVLHKHATTIDTDRLVDTLIDYDPRTIKARAVALRELRSGTNHKLTALTIINLYNRTPGPKLPPVRGL